MGVAFVQGLQGDDPQLPEGRRDRQALRRPQRPRGRPPPLRRAARASATCTRPTCPRSRRWCRRRRSASVMGAYNRVNGESASAQPAAAAARSCARTGASTATSCPTAAPSTTSTSTTRSWRRRRRRPRWASSNGCDLECGSGLQGARAARWRRGCVTEADLDVALTRLFTARLRLGMFDPPERVPYARIPYSRQRVGGARRARAARRRRRRSCC